MPPRAHQALRRTKIVATVGPASQSVETLRRLIDAGVSVFRLNFSHGKLDEHALRLRAIRQATKGSGQSIAVLGDLCGPKIRLGMIADPGLRIEAGQEVLLQSDRTSTDPTPASGSSINGAMILGVAYPALQGEEPVPPGGALTLDVKPGHRVLIADGVIRMLATAVDERGVRCVVHVGGIVTSKKGVNLPDSRLRVPSITPRDWACVEWAVEHDLDFLALSFVRRAEEIHELRERLVALATRTGANRPPIPIVAKIEKPQAVAALDEIIEASDAIMVARGDLGVEMDIAQVPVVQKRILASCQEWGKPCIVATQMLETMIESAIPTRAEASDVANAVFDGTDAVMLSGETATGKHPVLVVETMRRIVTVAEEQVFAKPMAESPPRRLVESRYRTSALAHGAWHIARDVGALMVVCWSQQGGTARYLSQNNFRVPIVAYSSDERASRQMALLSGVTPIFTQPPPSGLLRDWTDHVEAELIARGWASTGEPVVLLAGKPLGAAKATNSIAILHIGDPTGGYRSHRS
jgi:pyruvate kinase